MNNHLLFLSNNYEFEVKNKTNPFDAHMVRDGFMKSYILDDLNPKNRAGQRIFFILKLFYRNQDLIANASKSYALSQNEFNQLQAIYKAHHALLPTALFFYGNTFSTKQNLENYFIEHENLTLGI